MIHILSFDMHFCQIQIFGIWKDKGTTTTIHFEVSKSHAVMWIPQKRICKRFVKRHISPARRFGAICSLPLHGMNSQSFAGMQSSLKAWSLRIWKERLVPVTQCFGKRWQSNQNCCMEASTVSAAEADLLMLRLEAHFFWTPKDETAERKDGSWWSARVVIYQRANIISIQKSPAVCIIVMQSSHISPAWSCFCKISGPPGTTTRAGVVTCPQLKNQLLFFGWEKNTALCRQAVCITCFTCFLRWFFRVFVELCGFWGSFSWKNTMVFKNARWKQK